MNFISALFAAFLLAACSPKENEFVFPEPESLPAIQINLSTSTPKVGERMDLTLRVSSETRLVLPPVNDWLDPNLEILNSDSEILEDDEKWIREDHLQLALFQVTNLTLFAESEVKTLSDEPQVLTLPFQSIQVESVLTEENPAPKFGKDTLPDFRGPEAFRRQRRNQIISAVAAVLVLLVIGIVFWILSRRPKPVPPPVPPHRIALKKIEELLQSDIWKETNIDACAVALSQILRHYIEGRFDIQAPEQTTEEFLEMAEASAPWSEQDQAGLQNFFRVTDQIKFAGSRSGVRSLRGFTQCHPDICGLDHSAGRAIMILRFAYPWFLLLLLLIPLWVWIQHSDRFRTKLHFPSAATLKKLPTSAAQRFQVSLPLMTVLGWILLVVALARPQSGLRQRTVTSDTIDIVLAIDTSTSMNAIDLGNEQNENRLDAVKKVAETFIEARPADRISLLAFAAMPYTKSPLTLDHGWLLNRLSELKTGELPDGTAVGTALVSAVNRLRESESSSKIIVLLTDGISNKGDISPQEAAPLAAKEGIKVYTIGAGSDGPVRYPVRDVFGRQYFDQVEIPIDTESLSHIAEVTGGRFFRARDNQELEEVFLEIDELERTEIELDEYTLYTEQFQWFAAASLGLLLLARLLTAGRLGRALS